MAISDLPHETQLLLTESIRQLESDAWLDDKSILRQLATDNTRHSLSAQALILERTRLLAGNNPLVADLAGEIQRVESGAGLVGLALAALAIVGGVGTAGAVLAGSTINVVLAWSALLGAHLAMLVLWTLGFAFARKSPAFMNNSLWGRITRRLFAGQRRLALVRATAALVARTRFVYWLYSLISHGLWTLFFISAALTLTWLFALHEYSFKWETTILPATFFVRFVEVLGWLPQQLGLHTPDPASVASLVDDQATRQAWATWMLAGVVIYGLLPRALLAGLSLRRCSRTRQRLALDLDQPYYVGLRQRLDALLRPAAQIIDPATGLTENPHLSAHAGRPATSGSSLIFGFELHDDVAWPPEAVPENVRAEGTLSSRDDRERLLQELAHLRPRRLVAACEARAGLDRGTLYFFGEVARHADEFGVLLLNQDQARQGRAQGWHEELVELGVPQELIFATPTAALRWLEDAHV